MKTVLVNREPWRITRVPPAHPLLIDRTGKLRLATTDAFNNAIWISNALQPPLLDSVLLHEVAHAITISHGLLPYLREQVPEGLWVATEEWAVGLLEKHGIEAAIITSQALGRPICVNGFCTQ